MGVAVGSGGTVGSAGGGTEVGSIGAGVSVGMATSATGVSVGSGLEVAVFSGRGVSVGKGVGSGVAVAGTGVGVMVAGEVGVLVAVAVGPVACWVKKAGPQARVVIKRSVAMAKELKREELIEYLSPQETKSPVFRWLKRAAQPKAFNFLTPTFKLNAFS